MNVTSRSCLLSCALVASASGLPQSAGAESPPAKTYVVTLSTASPAGTIVAREGLSLAGAGNAVRLELASADGSVLSRPVTFTSQGEIASNSQDGAVTCYNMAMNVLAREHQPAGAGPAAVFVRFGSSVVRVPLNTQAVQAQGSNVAIALDGRSRGVYATADTTVEAGVIINATVSESAGDLHSASFDEIHYLGTPANIVGRSTCVLQRSEAQPMARV